VSRTLRRRLCSCHVQRSFSVVSDYAQCHSSTSLRHLHHDGRCWLLPADSCSRARLTSALTCAALAAGASRCAAGFFALKGSRKPCQKCPHGRTTADDVTRQRVFTDCFVSPGYGLVSSTGVSTDGTGYLADGTSLSNDTAAVMTALECLVGYYGPGGTIRSTCVKCPAGSTTDDVAATSAAQCSSKPLECGSRARVCPRPCGSCLLCSAMLCLMCHMLFAVAQFNST
jgi:hypothetical protein